MKNKKTYELAKMAYDAYSESVGGKAFNGDPLPAFKDVPERIKYAWDKAALAIVPPAFCLGGVLGTITGLILSLPIFGILALIVYGALTIIKTIL